MKHFFIAFVGLCAFAKAYSQELSAQLDVVDFEKIATTLKINQTKKSVDGTLTVTFKMLKNAQEVYLDAINMEGVPLSNSDMNVDFKEKKVFIRGDFRQGTTYTTSFTYEGYPAQAAYFVSHNGGSQFWTQGQGKYTSHWLPSIDDMNDKIEFDITVVGPDYRTAITNGMSTSLVKDFGIQETTSDMEHPISSYLVALVAGDYVKSVETSTSGIPLEYYYYPEDTLKVVPTYRYSKQIFDFLETEIGVPYPWGIYKQVPVKDFLYAGMENASCTVFSDNFMVDEIGFTDRNYVNVNAHELAHQWFGNLVTEVKSDHHWLHEGFATYYALLAEREIFGDNYFYFKLFESAEELRDLSDRGKGQKLVGSGGSSLTYYQKGAWAVHILREYIGEEAFKKAVSSYLEKYAYKNVTTDDLMNEVALVTDKDLTDFKKNWLYQSAFQSQEALESLKKSLFMQQYFQLQAGRAAPLESKFTQLLNAIQSGNDYLGQEAVYQLSGEDIRATITAYKSAMGTGNVFIRQAIATSIQEVKEELEGDFYELLEDKSYITREQSFIKLWVYYQQKGAASSQAALLDKMDAQFGFADGNLRTLWFTLSLATPDYKPQESLARYQELIAYTSPEEPFALRQNAFQYLRQLDSFEKVSLGNLVQACVHPVWRFRESSRKYLEEQLKKPQNKELLKELTPQLNPEEQAYLKRIGFSK